jgi:hypothetical protein
LTFQRYRADQLQPDRGRSCRNALTMAAVMVDEIKLRAQIRPVDGNDQ